MRIIKNPVWGNSEKTQIICKFEYDDGRELIASVMDTEEGNPDWQEIFERFTVQEIDFNTEEDLEGHRKRIEERRLAQEQEERIAKQNFMFVAKSEAFEIDLIRDSDEVEMKTALRKAKSLIELNCISSALYTLEFLKSKGKI